MSDQTTDRARVREILAQHGIIIASSKDNQTMDELTHSIGGSGAMAPVLNTIQGFFDKRGAALVENKSGTYNSSYPEVVIALALAINEDRLNLTNPVDTNEGAMFIINLGATAFYFPGTIKLRVIDIPGAVSVLGVLSIPGQIGGSKWALNKPKEMMDSLFKKIQAYLDMGIRS